MVNNWKLTTYTFLTTSSILYIISTFLLICKPPKFVVNIIIIQFGSVAHETLFHIVVKISQIMPDHKISLLLS